MFPFIGKPNENIPLFFITRNAIKNRINEYKSENKIKGRCTQEEFENFIDNYPSYIEDLIYDDEHFDEFMEALFG